MPEFRRKRARRAQRRHLATACGLFCALAPAQERWTSPKAWSVEIPAPWHVLEASDLEQTVARARIEALKPALGGTARATRFLGLGVPTWLRLLNDCDAVLIQGAEDASKERPAKHSAKRTGPAVFCCIYDRSEGFTPNRVPERPSSAIFRMKSPHGVITISVHAERSDKTQTIASLETLLHNIEKQVGLGQPVRSQRSWWLALLPIALVGIMLLRMRHAKKHELRSR